MLEAEQSFRERQSSQTRFKRILDVSPSVPQPPRSRLATAGTAPSARIALSFDSTVEVSMISIYNNTLIIYLLSFVETPRKFIIAMINLRGVFTKLNKYIVFTMQTYKKLTLIIVI